MRNIALAGTALIILLSLGCSKKSEDQPKENDMAPAPAAQESAPAPMQNTEQGMNSDSSPSSDAQSKPMDAPENNGEASQDAHNSSGTE